MVVRIDSSEPKTVQLAVLDACEEPRVEDLSVGDFWVGDFYAERKTYTDFIGRLTDDEISIWRQIDALIDIDDGIAVLILEGGTREARMHTGVPMSSVLGALLSVSVKGVHIIPTDSTTGTADLLASMERRADSDGVETAAPRSVRQSPRVRPEERPRWLTEGLPNVSARRAVALLDEFDSFYRIANATRAELQVVDGIGEKTADEIYDAVRRQH